MSRILFSLAAVFLLLSTSAIAQNTASLNGVVSDPSGAVVRGATVTLQSESRGAEQHSKTNGDGVYVFPFVSPGSYLLSVQSQGFKRFQRTHIQVDTAQKSVADVRLEIGSATETVAVTGDRVLLNQSDGSVGGVIDRTLIENVPLNGRSLQSLFTMVPGVTLVAVGTSPDTTDGTIIVNGQRAMSNQLIVDGVSANVSAGRGPTLSPNVPTMNAVGGTQSLATIDDLQEFKVVTATYSAEYGTSPGGQFVLTTRSGTEHLHGSVYNYFRNEALDANDWFSNNSGFRRGQLRQNLFGGTLGGPIMVPHLYNGRSATFYFASFEGLQLVTPLSQVTNVPNLALRSAAAPALRPILNSFPTPNGADLGNGVANYLLHASQPSRVYTGAGRIDHAFTQKLQGFVRYTRSPSSTSALPGATTFYNNYSDIKTQSLTAALTWTAARGLANEARFNWSNTDSRNGAQSRLGEISLFNYLNGRSADSPPDSYATLAFRLPAGNITLQQGLSIATNQQFYAADSFSWTLGNHLLKFGGNVRRLNMTASPNTYNANMQFSSLNAVYTGVATALTLSSNVKAEPIFYDYGMFVNDDWKVASRLQLQLGLRWDVTPPPGKTGGLSPTAYSGGPRFTSVAALPAGSSLYGTTYRNFAPRVGLAYRLGNIGNNQPTIVRLGGGFFYDTNNAYAGAPFTSYPFGNTITTSNVAFPFSAAVSAPPAVSVPVVAPYGNIIAVDPQLKLPVTYSWSAAVEQSLSSKSSVSITYVGTAGRKLMQSFYMTSVANTRSVQYTKNGSNSSYNALQLQYQARLQRGLTAFGGYTWSRSIDDTNLEQNNYSTVPVRGDSDGDQRNVARLGLSYTGPKFRGNHLLSTLLGEWGGDFNVSAQSGLPFTVRSGFYVVANAAYQIVRANIVPGQPLWIDNPKAPGGTQLNVKAFSAPAISTQGNQGRNTLRGFATGQADVALRKQFHLTESLGLQFRAEAFNITNHANFGSFNASYAATTTTLGQATTTFGTALGGLNSRYQSGGPRNLQLALKVIF